MTPPPPLNPASRARYPWTQTGDNIWVSKHLRYRHNGTRRKDIGENVGFRRINQVSDRNWEAKSDRHIL